jgi:hypothetical protein
MSEPVLRQFRNVVAQADGTRIFLVTAVIVEIGTGDTSLPFPEVFVIQIVDPLTPKADLLARIAAPLELYTVNITDLYIKVDATTIRKFNGETFVRVANVNDLTNLPRSRDIAIREGSTEYLSPSAIFIFNDAPTAIAASQTIVDRVSTLTNDWYTFKTDFLPDPPPYEDFTLPQIGKLVLADLTTSYSKYKTVRINAEATRDAARLARETCRKDCLNLKVIYGILQQDVMALQAGTSAIAEIGEAATATAHVNFSFPYPTPMPPVYNVTTTVIQTNQARTWALGSDPRSFVTLLNRKITEVDRYAQLVAEADTKCNASLNALRTAEAALIAAQADEARELARVLTICPAFDPATV